MCTLDERKNERTGWDKREKEREREAPLREIIFESETGDVRSLLNC